MKLCDFHSIGQRVISGGRTLYNYNDNNAMVPNKSREYICTQKFGAKLNTLILSKYGTF
jgi:hypothetical protein